VLQRQLKSFNRKSLNRRFRRRRRREATGFEPLENVLGHAFSDVSLIRKALTHSSWTQQHPQDPHNERLEFLGDAVLELAVTSHIFEEYPHLAEGKLSKLRAEVVSTASLSKIGQELELEKWILTQANSVHNIEISSIMGNTIEALIGAVFLDGGWKAARQVVLTLAESQIKEAALKPGGSDWKSLLQERLAKKSGQRPKYLSIPQGTSPDPRFLATVSLYEQEIGRGEGRSKKLAEQEAAREALDRLELS